VVPSAPCKNIGVMVWQVKVMVFVILPSLDLDGWLKNLWWASRLFWCWDFSLVLMILPPQNLLSFEDKKMD
jgi:hypothetical protein